MTLPSLRNGPPPKDPRKHGNVYQLSTARLLAMQALSRADEALRGTRMLGWQVLILWGAVIALAAKVCL